MPTLNSTRAPSIARLACRANFFTATFAIARVYGYVAHFMESRLNNRLIRPAARYTGTLSEIALYCRIRHTRHPPLDCCIMTVGAIIITLFAMIVGFGALLGAWRLVRKMSGENIND